MFSGSQATRNPVLLPGSMGEWIGSPSVPVGFPDRNVSSVAQAYPPMAHICPLAVPELRESR